MSCNSFQFLWFDPGGQTGWAYAWVWTGDAPLITWSLGTIRNPEHHHELRGTIEHYYQINGRGPLAVGSESFTFRKSPDSATRREGLELVSREYIGVMKLICGDLSIPYEEQSPGILGGPLVTNAHLDALRLLPPPPLQANKDQIAATRHLVYRLLKTPAKSIIINDYKKSGLG